MEMMNNSHWFIILVSHLVGVIESGMRGRESQLTSMYET